MKTERDLPGDVNRVVRSWLHEARHEDAERVLMAVLNEVDTTPQRRTTLWSTWRESFMNNNVVRVGLVAAAVVIVAFIGIQVLGGEGVGGPAPSSSPDPSSASPQPSTSFGPSQPETPLPTASDASLSGGALAPGTYILDAPFPVRARLALGTRWSMWTTGVYSDAVGLYRLSPNPPLGAGLVIATIDNVYDDGCSPLRLHDPQVGESTLALAEALSAQGSTQVVTAPAEVTLDGYSGTYVAVRMDSSDCSPVVRWTSANIAAGQREAISGEIDQYWILDIEGTRVVVDLFSFTETRPEDLAEVEAVVESLDFQPSD